MSVLQAREGQRADKKTEPCSWISHIHSIDIESRDCQDMIERLNCTYSILQNSIFSRRKFKLSVSIARLYYHIDLGLNLQAFVYPRRYKL